MHYKLVYKIKQNDGFEVFAYDFDSLCELLEHISQSTAASEVSFLAFEKL